MIVRHGLTCLLVAAIVTALPACSPTPAPRAASIAASDGFGLPAMPARANDAQAHTRIELGRKMFFDRRLSFNGTMSCAMCHVPEQGFSATSSKTAVGIEGKSLRRNAPTLLNVAWQTLLFHDGREFSLATQAWLPLLHADEMANPSIGHVLQRIRTLADYEGRFERAFAGTGVGMETVGAALAAFELSLVSADSRFDRWRYRGDQGALSEQEQIGFRIFTGKGRCSGCHSVGESGALFSDGRFHVTGAGQSAAPDHALVVPLAAGMQTVLGAGDLAAFAEVPAPDLGRFEITLDPADRYAFKTASLRNIAHTAPYMHDGSLPTLEAVVDFYDGGGGEVLDKSALLMPLDLSSADKQALVAFLCSLDGANLQTLKANSRPLSESTR